MASIYGFNKKTSLNLKGLGKDAFFKRGSFLDQEAGA
jgi:hypothetical protein